jgi:polysaccharide pyruvyl transferase WcaK-like protein
VAARFHNLVFAVKLGKPTIAVSYSPKCDSLMSDVGLAEYVQPIKSLDVERLKAQFTQIESQAAQVRERLLELLPKRSEQARAQLDELSLVLFSGKPNARQSGAGLERVGQ